MTNNIIMGIAQVLDEKFEQVYPIYTDTVEEGLNPPGFLIKSLKGSQNLVLGNRYRQNEYFDITYFPSPSKLMTECMEIRQTLYDVLEYIQTENTLYRAKEMNWEIQDDVLHFFVDYEFFVIKRPENVESMTAATVTVEKKAGG